MIIPIEDVIYHKKQLRVSNDLRACIKQKYFCSKLENSISECTYQDKEIQVDVDYLGKCAGVFGNLFKALLCVLL